MDNINDDKPFQFIDTQGWSWYVSKNRVANLHSGPCANPTGQCTREWHYYVVLGGVSPVDVTREVFLKVAQDMGWGIELPEEVDMKKMGGVN